MHLLILTSTVLTLLEVGAKVLTRHCFMLNYYVVMHLLILTSTVLTLLEVAAKMLVNVIISA